MNNWDIRTIVNYLINKSETGNTFGVEEFNTVLNYASLSLFNTRLGMPAEYRLLPITKQSYALTTRILDSLGDFVTEVDLVYTNGLVDQPDDYLYPLSNLFNLAVSDDTCGVVLEPIIVELLDQNVYTMRRASVLTPISTDYPVYRIIGSTFKVNPTSIKRTQFSYLRKPTLAVVAVTLDAYDNEIYDSGNSTELDWNDSDKLELVNIILGDVGLNLRSEEILQVANQHKATGL